MKAFIDQIEKLTEAIRDPEYLFLILEPLQFYGIGLGVLGLIATFFLKNGKLQVAALAVIVICAVSVIPYLSARQSAQERIEKVYKIESPARVKGFTANTSNRLDHRWVFLVLAAAGSAALLVGPRRNRLGLGLAAVSVAFGLYAAHYSLWMHYQDSLAFHPNLKTNESPVQEKLRAKPTNEPSQPETKPTPASRQPEREIRPLTAGTADP